MLDFIEWYNGGMTRLTAEVCKIARAHFPKTLLVLPIGGGSENPRFGQDVSALVKVASQFDVHVRSTHGGCSSFAEGIHR